MKNSLKTGLAIALVWSAQVLAQAPTQTTSQGVMSRPAQQSSATSSTTGMQRKGSGKMSSGVTRNGNSNLSPTAPTNTQGSTSEGTASRASPGGAAGTNTKETRLPHTSTAAAGTKGTGKGTQTTGTGTQLPRPGTAGDTRPTRSAAGAKASSATDAGLTNSRSGDALNKAQNPPKMSPTATGTSSRNAQNAQTSTVSTSGKTGSRRPSSQAQVAKEAKKGDEMSATGYPSPTGAGKPGTPLGTAKGKTGNTSAKSYPQPNKTGNQ